MSNSIFPTLVGMTWDQVTAPGFNTTIKRAISGKEYRSLGMQYPLWTFTVAYDVLRDNNWNPTSTELQTLLGFYIQCHGSFDSFLFNNPNDNAVIGQKFATGDGVTTVFQLTRAYGVTFTLTEPVQNVNVLTNITSNTVVQGNYSVASGLVTFNSAPANGANLAWTGSYYYRCRFTDDSVDFNNGMRGLWDLQKLSFVGSVKSKV